MSDTVGKIPVQEKIAELESRIAALEKGTRVHSRITQEFSVGSPSTEMWAHWREMWKEFDEVMKSAFQKSKP